MEKDVNDVFDDIFLADNKLAENAFEEAAQLELNKESIEGFHLGYHRGAEIGAELGYYAGIVEAKLAAGNLSEKDLHNLLTIQELIEKYPRNNVEHTDLFSELDKIRAQYRKTCSLLKIDRSFPDCKRLSSF